MAKLGEEPGAERLTPALQAEELLGLGAEVASAIATALNSGRSDEAAELAQSLHFAEIADLLEQLKSEQRHQLVERLRVGFDPAILAELDDVVREEVAEQLEQMREQISEEDLLPGEDEKLARLAHCNARYDILHFEHVQDFLAEEDDEFMDPGGLLIVAEVICGLCQGVAVDPQSGTFV